MDVFSASWLASFIENVSANTIAAYIAGMFTLGFAKTAWSKLNKAGTWARRAGCRQLILIAYVLCGPGLWAIGGFAIHFGDLSGLGLLPVSILMIRLVAEFDLYWHKRRPIRIQTPTPAH